MGFKEIGTGLAILLIAGGGIYAFYMRSANLAATTEAEAIRLMYKCTAAKSSENPTLVAETLEDLRKKMPAIFLSDATVNSVQELAGGDKINVTLAETLFDCGLDLQTASNGYRRER